MGADFVYSVCPLPDMDKDKKEIEGRILKISNDKAHRLLELFHHGWEDDVDERIENKFGEEHLFKVDDLKNSFKKEIAQEIITDALEEVVASDYRRDLGHMFLQGKWWIISGGMTWGDCPTEAMTHIDILQESGVLDGLN